MKRRRIQLTTVAAGIAPLLSCAVVTAAKAQDWRWLILAFASALLSGVVWTVVIALRDGEKAKTRQLAAVYKGISEALASAVAAKDSYEQNHVRRVVAICELTGKALGLRESEFDGVRIAALLHDVGKLGVPDYIMLKPGPLDPDEFSKMRNHTAIGARILENVRCPWDLVSMVRHHHEKYDGTGYPKGLSGNQIPLGSRIIAVAEVYDALVSDRCYKEGWRNEDAIEYITKLSGSHFDPDVVEAFLSISEELPALYSSAKTEYGEGVCVERSCAAADEIARANQELVSLFEIAQTLSSTLELDEVLGLLTQRTRRLLQAATCVVFLSDEKDKSKLAARAVAGLHAETAEKASVVKGMGATGTAYLQGKPYVGDYDPSDLIVSDSGTRQPLRSCMVVPIINHGRPMGTINVYDDSSNAFSADDLHMLTSVADRAALAIQNARAFEHIRDSAMKDPLTGLYNSRHLRAHLQNEIRRAQRQDQALSVLVMDLDNFKAVNDTMGHQAGDTVLQQSAGILLAQLRDYDHVARIGGDEFVVILPGTPANEANLIAERVRRKIESYARKALSACRAPLSASVGVASYPDDAEDLDSLLARADAAMYEIKRAHKQDHLAA